MQRGKVVGNDISGAVVTRTNIVQKCCHMYEWRAAFSFEIVISKSKTGRARAFHSLPVLLMKKLKWLLLKEGVKHFLENKAHNYGLSTFPIEESFPRVADTRQIAEVWSSITYCYYHQLRVCRLHAFLLSHLYVNIGYTEREHDRPKSGHRQDIFYVTLHGVPFLQHPRHHRNGISLPAPFLRVVTKKRATHEQAFFW